MISRTLRAWIVFVLAFLMPMQAFASAVQCHSPISATASTSMAAQARHASGHDHAANMMYGSEAGPTVSANEMTHQVHEDLSSQASGQHTQFQDVCFNCAPCNASAPLVQASTLQFAESRPIHAAAVTVPLYLSVLTPGLDRPPQ